MDMISNLGILSSLNARPDKSNVADAISLARYCEPLPLPLPFLRVEDFRPLSFFKMDDAAHFAPAQHTAFFKR
jgi:hypothetical protein